MFMVLTFLNFHFKAMFVGNFTTMALEKKGTLFTFKRVHRASNSIKLEPPSTNQRMLGVKFDSLNVFYRLNFAGIIPRRCSNDCEFTFFSNQLGT